MASDAGRREFMALLAGALASRPIPAYAQQAASTPTVGVLLGLANDVEARVRIEAFERGLERKGWSVGQNLRIEYRFTDGNPGRMQEFAKELAKLKPNCILGHSTPVVAALMQASRTIPIVFVSVSDPVGSGFVESMARPGSNVTGFTILHATITGKYLSMLRDMVPQLAHVAIMYNPDSLPGAETFFLRPFLASATKLRVKPITAQVRNPAEIERAMAELGSEPDRGLILTPDNFITVNRDLIISLAAQFRIPAIYPYRYFAEGGGLLSYGVEAVDLFSRASEYISRILHGEKPADLPVQAPNKFETVINLRTAKALGLVAPRSLLASADAVIE